jgi:S-adenosylmethionine hydrolase
LERRPISSGRRSDSRPDTIGVMQRPVIGFLTDFGLDGAAAICRGVMLSIAREAQIVDISHVVRKFSIVEGAYVLRSAVPWLPVGVHVAVVDPGVGTARRPIGLLTARGDILIGPDNGLLLAAAEELRGIVEARILVNRAWMLPVTSSTFHGRDIFAPVAAHLALGESFVDAGPVLDTEELVQLDLPSVNVKPGRLETVVTYVDSFGNLRLAGDVAKLELALSSVAAGAKLVAELAGGAIPLTFSSTFGDVAVGVLLLYRDSSGNLAIGESNGDAARRLGVATGARIGIRRP